jgi:DNA-binding SARP family transcriptional activator
VLRRVNVSRPRLLRRLHGRFSTRVTVLVAPAGFGKTTLLTQMVAENRLAPRGVDFWLTCCDNDVAGSVLAGGLCQTMGVSSFGDTEAAIARIVEATWHQSPNEVALVIDDVQLIPAGSSGAEVLARLVAALPHNGHLVLSGRQTPQVALSRLEVQGGVERLGESDLRFTEDELVEFYASRGVAADQLTPCGGWPALAELTATAGPRVEAAYLWEEVLATTPSDRRHDLALLAHVGPFDDRLARAVLGRETDVAELTAELPLVAVTPAGGREVHSLWRPHLAKVVEGAAIAEARRRAGIELAASGEGARAVHLLAEAGAWDDVTGVVTDLLGAAHPPVAGDVVAAWLGRLPDHQAGGPLARLLNAVGTVQTDPPAARAALEDAADAFRADGDLAGELACIAQLAQLAWWSEDHDRMLRLLRRLFEMEALGDDKVKPLACLGRALLADIAADCETVLDELGAIPPGSLHETALALVGWLRSTSLCHLGRPAEALEAATAAGGHPGSFVAPIIEAARLQALWYLGNIEEALAGFPPVVDQVLATGLRDQSALVAATTCLAFAAAGRVADASRYLATARHSAAAPALPLVDVNLVIAEAATAVARGDEDAAARILIDYLERAGPVDNGLAAFAQRRSLSYWYVLAPASRPAWDAAALGPTFQTARRLAEAVVALRSNGRISALSPSLPPPEVVQALLPLPWTTKLALGHIAAGRQAGWALLESVWPEAQPEVRRHAERGRKPMVRAARSALGRLPVPPVHRYELRLLGPVELYCDGSLVDNPDWRRQRVRSLLVALVLSRRRVSRERLAADLWPNLDPDGQSRNLRVTMTYLLRVLEPERGERDASFLIRTPGLDLVLHSGEWFDTDIWAFDQLWQQATDADRDGAPTAALAAMTRAIGLWRGDPLELAAYDWALPEVEERTYRLVTMASRAGELLLARGDADEARHLAETALRHDPWCERAHRVVVSAHDATGHHHAARDAQQRYQEALTELSSL